MGLAIGAHESRAIHRESDGQFLDRDIVHDLVVAALQEGRIDRGERPHAFASETGGKGHRMLLGDADIEAASREALGEFVEARARGHRGRDRDDSVVVLGFGDESLGEDVLIVRRAGLGLHLRAGRDVELHDAMIFVRRLLGRRVAMAFAGDDMHQHRAAIIAVAEILQHRQQMIEIVAVDRADIVEAELFEERAAAGHHAAGIFLGPAERIGETAREAPRHRRAELAQAHIGLRGQQPAEIGAHRADRRRDRHVVIVEDDDQPRIH